MPTTFSGRDAAEAISPIESDEVFVAKNAVRIKQGFRFAQQILFQLEILRSSFDHQIDSANFFESRGATDSL